MNNLPNEIVENIFDNIYLCKINSYLYNCVSKKWDKILKKKLIFCKKSKFFNIIYCRKHKNSIIFSIINKLSNNYIKSINN